LLLYLFPVDSYIALLKKTRLLKLLVDKCLEIHYRHPLGVCLEERYHAKFHEEFGYGGNTEEQFYEFLDNYYNGKYKDLEEVS